MSRRIVSQLKWNHGVVWMINGRKFNGFDNARILGLKNGLLCEQRSWNLNNYRMHSTRQSVSDTSNAPSATSILPKINALINDSRKVAPASRNIIDNGKSLFRRQWEAFFNWYDEISHTNEVRDAHKQVEDLQDKMSQAQQMRRDVSKELNDIRYELQMCFADQANCQKNDPRYLELIRREIQVGAIFFSLI